jgi:fructose-specific phosphotransferase system IIC component
MPALLQNRDAPGELTTTASFHAAHIAPLRPIAQFPETLRRFLLRKGGATVVLLGVCFCLMIAAAFGVPRADWALTVSMLALLRKLLARAPA